jgi:hypothetical protein
MLLPDPPRSNGESEGIEYERGQSVMCRERTQQFLRCGTEYIVASRGRVLPFMAHH